MEGCLLEVMTVVTPAPVAISAAMSFVSIPPVPRLEPNVDVLTVASLNTNHTQKRCRKLTLCSDVCYGPHDVDLPRSRIFSWVCGVQSVNIGEEEEVISVNHRRSDCREGVIVAKFYFLHYPQPASTKKERKSTHTNRDRVIFVHDRHHSHTQELPDRVHSIQVSRSLPEMRLSRKKEPIVTYGMYARPKYRPA